LKTLNKSTSFLFFESNQQRNKQMKTKQPTTNSQLQSLGELETTPLLQVFPSRENEI
jgi:hypothetical protein